MQVQKTILFLGLIFVAAGCKYHKGDMYTSLLKDDSLVYVIAVKGQGEKVSQKALNLKLNNEFKGNSCTLTYLTDSAILIKSRGLLLLNSSLPDIKEDMLTKGYFGTFTSKQMVTYKLVSYDDFGKFFIEKADH